MMPLYSPERDVKRDVKSMQKDMQNQTLEERYKAI
jgi:hypothetical protein